MPYAIPRRLQKTLPQHPNPPANCDHCAGAVGDVFYDMRTKSGLWANLCARCALDGVGCGRTGEGHGQKYVRRPNSPDKAFRKMEG